jgi:hypothetical protein
VARRRLVWGPIFLLELHALTKAQEPTDIDIPCTFLRMRVLLWSSTFICFLGPFQQPTVMSSAKGQKGAQRRNKTKKLNQRKILGGFTSGHSVLLKHSCFQKDTDGLRFYSHWLLSLDVDLARQSGVRRSSRIRSRPLEYWLGERLLYGPIQDSKYTDLAHVLAMQTFFYDQDLYQSLMLNILQQIHHINLKMPFVCHFSTASRFFASRPFDTQ